MLKLNKKFTTDGIINPVKKNNSPPIIPETGDTIKQYMQAPIIAAMREMAEACSGDLK